MSKVSLRDTEILNEIGKEHSIGDEKGFDINSRVLIIDGL
tara:strand:- start:28 stop:147 length:120 start_codon:yes stop_codon:yes gene_type:complete